MVFLAALIGRVSTVLSARATVTGDVGVTLFREVPDLAVHAVDDVAGGASQFGDRPPGPELPHLVLDLSRGSARPQPRCAGMSLTARVVHGQVASFGPGHRRTIEAQALLDSLDGA
ncbi:hypothetical protein AB0N93_16450 [Streptomyces sp. NPDC091267]|uniref:hypothetical protein n=1 Tax=unclassified Streptomyces TaxID=2593676 RepID=UPI00342D9232